MRKRCSRWASVAVLVAAVQGLAAETPDATAPVPVRPHILCVLADDLGWRDVGFHGSDIQTPNLDRLAAQGAVFSQFCSQAMCTPSRAALLTGRYPHRYGLQTGVIPSAGTFGLATDEWLLPQALKDAGYRTAIVGKWHLGHADPKYWPRQVGARPACRQRRDRWRPKALPRNGRALSRQASAPRLPPRWQHCPQALVNALRRAR